MPYFDDWDVGFRFKRCSILYSLYGRKFDACDAPTINNLTHNLSRDESLEFSMDLTEVYHSSIDAVLASKEAFSATDDFNYSYYSSHDSSQINFLGYAENISLKFRNVGNQLPKETPYILFYNNTLSLSMNVSNEDFANMKDMAYKGITSVSFRLEDGDTLLEVSRKTITVDGKQKNVLVINSNSPELNVCQFNFANTTEIDTEQDNHNQKKLEDSYLEEIRDINNFNARQEQNFNNLLKSQNNLFRLLAFMAALLFIIAIR